MRGTRDRLIEAAEAVLRERGLAHLSTREVARTAGVAEGLLYHHFEDKNALLLAVIALNGPAYLERIRNLPLLVGQATLRENLTAVAFMIYDFHRHALPITCSLFADVELLDKHRKLLRANNAGPARTYEAINAYLLAEQRMGRMAKKADVESVSTILVGSAFQLAFLEAHWGQKLTQAEARRKLDGVVQTLLKGLSL